MLNCPQCGYDNDIGRIFCAKCGQKLEISRVGVPSSVRRGARRGKKGLAFGQLVQFLLRKLFQVTILAAAVAFLVSVWLLPRESVRPGGEKDLESFQKKRAAFEEAFGSQAGGQFVFSEEELNSALALAVANTRKAAGENAGGLQLEKLTVALGQGTATLTITQKYKWFRLAVQSTAKLQNDGARWSFAPTEIRIGRWLTPALLHPQLVPVLQKFLADLATEQQRLGEAAGAEIRPGEFAITAPKPAA